MWLIYRILTNTIFIVMMPYVIYRFIKDPKEWKERLGIYPEELKARVNSGSVIWIHASSVGEVKASRPLIESLRIVHPGAIFIMSTMTASGQSVASKAKLAEVVIYFPFDMARIVRKALEAFKPKLFIAVETEIWPNFIRQAGKKGIAMMIACGRISPRSFRSYRLFKTFFRKVLAHIDLLSMQTELDARRIAEIGAESRKIKITGSIKYDLSEDAVSIKKERVRFNPLHKCIVAGSTHRGEEDIIIDVYKELCRDFNALKIIIAPRHINRLNEVAGILKKKNIDFIRWTEISAVNYENKQYAILLDTMGELFNIYDIADVVFIGGSMVNIGGHNILEPASMGKAVVFGPYMENFREIAELFIKNKAAVQVRDGNELSAVLTGLLKDNGERERLGKNAVDLIMANRGAAMRNAELTKGLIKK